MNPWILALAYPCAGASIRQGKLVREVIDDAFSMVAMALARAISRLGRL